jgi:hypothetical protein
VPSNFANKWLCSNGLTLAQNLTAVVESLKGSLEQKSEENLAIRAQYDQLATSYNQNQSNQVSTSTPESIVAIYASMIYTAPCVMFLMRADPLRVEGVWTLEIESFLGPVKWHRDDRRVPIGS